MNSKYPSKVDPDDEKDRVVERSLLRVGDDEVVLAASGSASSWPVIVLSSRRLSSDERSTA